jgi:hypothetical protein
MVPAVLQAVICQWAQRGPSPTGSDSPNRRTTPDPQGLETKWLNKKKSRTTFGSLAGLVCVWTYSMVEDLGRRFGWW